MSVSPTQRDLLLEIEGAILGYWTDMPEPVLEDFRVRIRAELEGSDDGEETLQT